MVAAEAPAGPPEARSNRTALVRAVAASALATTLEWYDFFLYGYAAATVLGRLFFPTTSPFLGTLLSLVTYAMGFAVRPLGAMLFGRLGDRIGRRATLIATLMLTGLATALVAAVPTYAEAGVAGGIILALLRLVQGLAVGGQWAGAVLLSVEWGHRGRRGFLGSWTQLGLPAGLALAYGAMQLSTSWLGPDTGWRLPFLLGVLPIAAALYVRLGVRETPVFTELVAERRIEQSPLLDALRWHWREVLVTALLRTGQQAPFYLFTTFILTDATAALKLQRTDVLRSVLIAAGASVLALLVFGLLSDVVGRRRMVMIGAALMLLWSYPYWALLTTHVPLLVLLAVVLSLPVQDVQYAPQAALIAESFTARLRYTGAALGSQLGSLIADGPAPLIAFVLLRSFGDPRFIAAYMAACAVISVAAAAVLKDRSRQDMAAEYDDRAPAVTITAASP